MDLLELTKACFKVVDQRRAVFWWDCSIFLGSLDEIAHVQGFGLLSEEQDGVKDPRQEDKNEKNDV